MTASSQYNRSTYGSPPEQGPHDNDGRVAGSNSDGIGRWLAPFFLFLCFCVLQHNALLFFCLARHRAQMDILTLSGGAKKLLIWSYFRSYVPVGTGTDCYMSAVINLPVRYTWYTKINLPENLP